MEHWLGIPVLRRSHHAVLCARLSDTEGLELASTMIRRKEKPQQGPSPYSRPGAAARG